MALSTLDPKIALILIDLQQGTLAFPTVHAIGDVVGRAAVLVAAFRSHGLPVVLVNVAGAPRVRTEQARGGRNFAEGWTDLLPELNQQPTDHTITKHTPGAFTKTGLEDHLRSMGVTQVVLAGVSTSNGVESTARHAYEFGFHVTFAVDAMTDTSMDAHTHSLTKIFPRLGETGTTENILDLLNSTRV